jgi:hypothetical protein
LRNRAKLKGEIRSSTVDTNLATASLAAILALVAVAVWFDARCLTDLSQSRDAELRYLTRAGWAVAILISFPLGGLLYLRYGKVGRPFL